MKPKNFAFVVGFAVLVAFVLCMAVSCGSPDCPCEYPSMDGGVDGEAPDWYRTHYSECADMCDAAREWVEHCDRPPMRDDCVEWLWYRWTAPERCYYAVACYDALVAQDDCLDTWETDEGWNPPTWASGCAVEVP